VTIDTWWLSITATAYAVAKTKGQTMNERRYVKEIAKSVISNFPSAPHLYALEQLTSVGNLQPDLWRQVLIKIDELDRMRLNRNCAMRMIVTHGDQAHLVALMNLHHEEEHGSKTNIDWREVLKQMDELKGENK